MKGEAMVELKRMEMMMGYRLGRIIAGTWCVQESPANITEAVFENGVLYILNASATQSDQILEVK